MSEKATLSVEELMKKSLTFALAATLLAGTSNISKVKDKIKVSENETGHIVIEQMNDQAFLWLSYI